MKAFAACERVLSLLPRVKKNVQFSTGIHIEMNTHPVFHVDVVETSATLTKTVCCQQYSNTDEKHYCLLLTVMLTVNMKESVAVCVQSYIEQNR